MIEQATPHHYLLIKQADHTARGAPLSALDAARRILDAGVWPLWDRTPCKFKVTVGDHIAVYLAGRQNQCVVATSTVQDKRPWTAAIARSYPLALGGVPSLALFLSDITWLTEPIAIRERITKLSFGATRKWGVHFMGGMRSVSPDDFATLTRQANNLSLSPRRGKGRINRQCGGAPLNSDLIFPPWLS